MGSGGSTVRTPGSGSRTSREREVEGGGRCRHRGTPQLLDTTPFSSLHDKRCHSAHTSRDKVDVRGGVGEGSSGQSRVSSGHSWAVVGPPVVQGRLCVPKCRLFHGTAAEWAPLLQWGVGGHPWHGVLLVPHGAELGHWRHGHTGRQRTVRRGGG